MRAMVLREFGAPLAKEEVAIPQIGPWDVLLKVKACGLCGTDLKIKAGKLPIAQKLPLIMGHEVAGDVVEVGSEVKDVERGQRAAVKIYVTCGKCQHCRTGRETICFNLIGQIGFNIDGGYAEFARIPAENICRVPDGVSYEEAAIMADAVATPFHALRERAKLRLGDTVAIVGAGGGVGLNAVQIAKLCGARVIAIDVADESLSLARDLGADETVNARERGFDGEVKKLTDGRGAEVVLELVASADTMPLSLNSVRRGGKLVFVGYSPGVPLMVQPLLMVLDELEIIGARATTKQEMAEAMNIVARSKLKPIITREYPLEEAETAHRDLEEGKIVGRAVLKI